MPGFAGPLDTRAIETKAFRFALLAPLPYEARPGRWIIVEAGFWTDFGSVPWYLTWLISRAGAAAKPYVVHDWVYHLIRQGVPHKLAPTRADADRVLREAMLARGCSRLRAWTVWLGVRLGGWTSLIDAKPVSGQTEDVAPAD